MPGVSIASNTRTQLVHYHLFIMFPTYSAQVMDAADADGLLTPILAKQLMDDHNTTLYKLEREGYKGHCRDAFALLEWLGY